MYNIKLICSLIKVSQQLQGGLLDGNIMLIWWFYQGFNDNNIYVEFQIVQSKQGHTRPNIKGPAFILCCILRVRQRGIRFLWKFTSIGTLTVVGISLPHIN